MLSWREMWTVLKTHVTSDDAAVHTAFAGAAEPASAAAGGASQRRIDRRAIAASSSAATSNIVTHPGYSERDRRIALLNDHQLGHAYLQEHLNQRGTRRRRNRHTARKNLSRSVSLIGVSLGQVR